MKLVEIEVRGYRSLFQGDDGHFCLELGDGVNAIVGPNNVGKSNLFRALALALDPEFEFDRQRDMPANWVWSKPTVTLTFQIQEKATPSRERTLLKRLRDYEGAVRPGGKSCFADDRQVKLRATIEGGEESSGVLRRAFVTKGAGARDLGDANPVAVKALKQFDECARFVLVRSGESLESLLQGRFRDVLQAILKAELKTEYEAAATSREHYVGDLQGGLLATLRNRLTDELRELFPEIGAVELAPGVRGLEDTLTEMQVKVSDTATTDLSDKGTGVRGGLIVAMLQHLAAASNRSMVFAIEEPESFLHPAAQEALRDDLEELAKRRDVSLMVTTHSPYVISRRPEASVASVNKDADGRTVISHVRSGDARLSESLDGLFRSSLLAGYLDRASRSVDGEKAILLVEGETDRSWLRLAAERSDRLDLLDGLTIVAAGDEVPGDSGGATLAATQALVLRAASDNPVGVLFDNDEEGRQMQQFFRDVNHKTKEWEEGQRVFCYRGVFDSADKKFGYEAEDLWPDDLFEQFLRQPGCASYLSEKLARPNPAGGYHYGIKSAGKPELAGFLEKRVRASDCDLWIRMLEEVRSGLGL